MSILPLLSIETSFFTPHLPDRKRKIHEHPVDLGEVHLFPDITKWGAGLYCCAASSGRPSKRGPASREQIHSLATKRKRWGFTSNPDKCSQDTPRKHPSIVLQAHVLYCLLMKQGWVSLKPVLAHTMGFNLISYTQKVITSTFCFVAFIIACDIKWHAAEGQNANLNMYTGKKVCMCVCACFTFCLFAFATINKE